MATFTATSDALDRLNTKKFVQKIHLCKLVVRGQGHRTLVRHGLCLYKKTLGPGRRKETHSSINNCVIGEQRNQPRVVLSTHQFRFTRSSHRGMWKSKTSNEIIVELFPYRRIQWPESNRMTVLRMASNFPVTSVSYLFGERIIIEFGLIRTNLPPRVPLPPPQRAQQPQQDQQQDEKRDRSPSSS